MEDQSTRLPRHFEEPHLQVLNADVLKPMSRLWGGKGNERKDACVQRILAGLADEQAVQAALASLTPEERAALALLKAHGGVMRAGALEADLLASGYPVAKEPRFGFSHEQRSPAVAALVRRGLVLPQPSPVSYYGDIDRDGVRVETYVYSDDRLLRQVNWPLELRALEVRPVDPPPVATHRRSHTVLLDLLAVARALEVRKVFSLTKDHQVRVADQRQFRKALQWEETPSFDGHAFPAISEALLAAWRQLRLLREGETTLTWSAEAEDFLRRPLAEQVRAFAQAFSSLFSWNEVGESRWGYPEDLRALRLAVLRGLQALSDPSGWYTLESLVSSLYTRVGVAVASTRTYGGWRPYRSPGQTEADYRTQLAEWEMERRTKWIARERKAVHAILTSWLYWLGLVETGETPSAGLAFRLTELGREALLGLESAPSAPSEESGEAPPAWVVQPNFDLVVYLDAVSPEQLTFLEQHAARRQTEAHTVHYVVTSESIHRGLEAGSTVESVLETLQQGAHAELPQNVVREIQEWARQRERLVIHTRARLVAFASEEDRTRALEAGVTGEPIGDTFLRLAAEAPVPRALKTAFGRPALLVLDYAEPPAKCLRAEEDGTLTLVRQVDDLLLAGQLANCAEPVDEKHWRLTKDSLAKVRAAGVPANTLLAFLHSRLLGPLPALVEIALRNALGARATVQSGPVLAVRIADKALYSALVTSPTAQRYLLDVPGPDTLLIAPEHQEEFLSLLDQLSVRPTSLTEGGARPDWRQTVRDAQTQQRRRYRRY